MILVVRMYREIESAVTILIIWNVFGGFEDVKDFIRGRYVAWRRWECSSNNLFIGSVYDENF